MRTEEIYHYASRLVSDCCGAAPVGNSEEFSFCDRCREHCEYMVGNWLQPVKNFIEEPPYVNPLNSNL